MSSEDELAGLFAQERELCEQELAAMDSSALAAQALQSAGLTKAPLGDGLDLELQELFSVERAQVMQEAQAALLPTAPGLAASTLPAPTLLARVPMVAKWSLGLGAAAGLAVVSAAAIQGQSPSSWTRERVDSAAAWLQGEQPIRVVAPRIEAKTAPQVEASRVSRVPRLVPQVPGAVTVKPSSGRQSQSKVADVTKPTLEDKLRRLEAQAQQAWKAEDRRGAEQKFKEIIKIAPQSAFAQWAWGDLFLLAKQKGDVGIKRELWKRYLQAHPMGRFADAAYAGLCSSHSQDAARCWATYLERFPNGAFVKKARRRRGE